VQSLRCCGAVAPGSSAALASIITTPSPTAKYGSIHYGFRSGIEIPASVCLVMSSGCQTSGEMIRSAGRLLEWLDNFFVIRDGCDPDIHAQFVQLQWQIGQLRRLPAHENLVTDKIIRIQHIQSINIKSLKSPNHQISQIN
jgi:hypothetical protein